MEQEVIRLMDASLTLLQESIKESPGEWLWQHNRWKQQTPQNIYKQFRHDCISIILPQDKQQFEAIAPHLPTLKKIYEGNFLVFIAPEQFRDRLQGSAEEIIYYQKIREVLLDDYRFKLVFNFTDYKLIYAHYESLSAFAILDLQQLRALAKPHLPDSFKDNLSEIFLRALCRPGSLWSAT
jgi:hypothetical protein